MSATDDSRPLRSIASRLATEDAVVTANLAGALLSAVLALASSGQAGARPRMLLPRGHAIRLGAPLPRLLALVGVETVEVGAVDECRVDELAAALPACDGGLYVVDEAAVRGGLDLPGFLWQVRQAGRPAVVLDPASGNWAAWFDGGADLVVLDAARGFGGSCAGVVAGRADLVARCRRLLSDAGAPFAAPPGTAERVAAASATWRPRPEPRVEAVAWRRDAACRGEST